MQEKRTSGILLHPTSLPSRFGIGDLGEEAYRFVDFLADNFQQFWQILPLGPIGYGNSPYSCFSAFAGNPLLISLEKLQAEGLLTKEDLSNIPEFPEDKVDYELVIQTKTPLLKKACREFQIQEGDNYLKREFEQFCLEHQSWLGEYTLFMAIKESQGGVSWSDWEKPLAMRSPVAIDKAKQELAQEIYYHQFVEFYFFRQWRSLKDHANHRGVQIIGDLPIYVAHDSADVWSNPQFFCLDRKTLKPSTMAGVPPDYFSADGQLWGNPVYLWKVLEEDDFRWWIARIKAILKYVDIIRIDHFLGFESFWAVKPGEATAVKGKWVKAPGEKFFTILEEELGHIPVIAEDLGSITPEVEALRDRFNFPGMKILQFAFDADRCSEFLPYNYVNRNCVVYTGTHDNDTTMGWFMERSPEEQARVSDYLGCICPEGIHWSLIRLALSSVANMAIFPLQDILGLGTWARTNVPGTLAGNWIWRYAPGSLTKELGERLKYYTWLYGRAPN
ncbi:4-alpha-glucanotransferase [Gloeocapsa sp. PCC 73106]|nr:4-alpha-glucanotransferase [Gloeocapsa sp. PCC 73106]